jgi:F-type H+-transporting ATPase subunit a
MTLKKIGILTLFIFIISSIAFSSEPDEKHHEESNAQEKFEPGPFIMDHILDSYDWHIATLGETHISIPLPVILYSKHSGFHIFMSSKFHHGHSAYKGFEIAHDGENKGTIVEHLDEGTIYSPFDISITKNVAAILFTLTFICWLFISIANKYKKNVNQAPSGVQNALEPFILFVRDDIARPAIGEKKYERFMPYLLSIFFFIFISNLMGLIPIPPFGANVTGNIAVTFVLAIFTFVITTFVGNKYYWKHIFWPDGVPVWLKIPPIMPMVELIGVFTKPFVLMVRLFANIAAGHIIALGFFSLIFIFGNMSVGTGYAVSVGSVSFAVFMTMLELLVAIIQALVFTLLSAIYFGMAVEEHH